MIKTCTHLFLFLIICLSFGCSKKALFSFSNDTGSFGNYQNIKSYSGVTPDEAVPEGANIDSIVYTASAQLGLPEATARPASKIRISPPKAVEYYKTREEPKAKFQEKWLPVPKILLKKTLKKLSDEGGKETHTLANISLALGLGSILFLILLSVVPGVLTLFTTLMFLSAIGAIVTGRLALKDIKKNPETWIGKGKAQAGFILGLVVSAVFLLLLVLAIIFWVLLLNSFTKWQ